jgi:DNA-binding Xre family transcriptional regulator
VLNGDVLQEPVWLYGDVLSVSWWLKGDVLNGDVLQEPGWLYGDVLSVSWWLKGDVLNGDVLQEPGWLHGDVLSDARSDLSMTSTLFVYYSHELCVHMIYVSVSVSPSGVFKKKICYQDVTNPSKIFFHDRVCPYHTHLSDLPHMATHHCAQAKSLVSTLLLLLLNPSVPARALQTPVGTGIMPMGAGLGNMPSPWAKPGPDTPIVVGSNDPGEGDDDTSVGLSESEVTRLQTNDWKFVRRYEQLAGECDDLESKISRLCRSLEDNPDDPDTLDSLGGAQSSLHKMQQAMRRLHSTIEANCQQLNEAVDEYLPYDDVA